MATGGGRTPALKLRPWEEACRGLMDTCGMEGVGDAECGAEATEDEPGTSRGTTRQPVAPPKKRKRVDPLPPMPAPSPPPATSSPVDRATSTPTATTPSPAPMAGQQVQKAAVLPPPTAMAQPTPPAPVVTGAGTGASVTITLVDVPPPVPSSPAPATPDMDTSGGAGSWDEEVVESPNARSIPYDHGERPGTTALDAIPEETPEAVLGEVLERLARLEEMATRTPAIDATLVAALERQSVATEALVGALATLGESDVEGAVASLQSDVACLREELHVAEVNRQADAKRQQTLTRGCMHVLAQLRDSTQAQTEQHRLNGEKAVTAIGELTAVLRLHNPPPPCRCP